MREKWRGNSKLTTKSELEEILALVKANSNDVFCDLGCGEGLLCIWASHIVKHAIGIEDHKETYQKALKNKRTTNRTNITLIPKDYNEIEKIPAIKKSTIFFCSNTLDYSFYRELQNFLYPKEVYFVSQYFTPFPIKSKCYNKKWFVTKTPFKIAKTEKQWIESMFGKGKTKRDLLRFMSALPNYKQNKKELKNDFDYINWLKGNPTRSN